MRSPGQGVGAALHAEAEEDVLEVFAHGRVRARRNTPPLAGTAGSLLILTEIEVWGRRQNSAAVSSRREGCRYWATAR